MFRALPEDEAPRPAPRKVSRMLLPAEEWPVAGGSEPTDARGPTDALDLAAAKLGEWSGVE